MSTQAARCEEGRKAMSPVKPSKLRSKAVPINWPLLLNTETAVVLNLSYSFPYPLLNIKFL